MKAAICARISDSNQLVAEAFERSDPLSLLHRSQTVARLPMLFSVRPWCLGWIWSRVGVAVRAAIGSPQHEHGEPLAATSAARRDACGIVRAPLVRAVLADDGAAGAIAALARFCVRSCDVGFHRDNLRQTLGDD